MPDKLEGYVLVGSFITASLSLSLSLFFSRTDRPFEMASFARIIQEALRIVYKKFTMNDFVSTVSVDQLRNTKLENYCLSLLIAARYRSYYPVKNQSVKLSSLHELTSYINVEDIY